MRKRLTGVSFVQKIDSKKLWATKKALTAETVNPFIAGSGGLDNTQVESQEKIPSLTAL